MCGVGHRTPSATTARELIARGRSEGCNQVLCCPDARTRAQDLPQILGEALIDPHQAVADWLQKARLPRIRPPAVFSVPGVDIFVSENVARRQVLFPIEQKV